MSFAVTNNKLQILRIYPTKTIKVQVNETQLISSDVTNCFFAFNCNHGFINLGAYSTLSSINLAHIPNPQCAPVNHNFTTFILHFDTHTNFILKYLDKI